VDEDNYYNAWDHLAQASNSREVRLQFQLNTLPAGTPTWFIARQHRFTSA
jgi:hypothetical protein